MVKQINHIECHEELKTRTRQMQCVALHLEIPGKPNNTTEILSKRESLVEPRLANQQTKTLRPEPTKISLAETTRPENWPKRPTYQSRNYQPQKLTETTRPKRPGRNDPAKTTHGRNDPGSSYVHYIGKCERCERFTAQL